MVISMTSKQLIVIAGAGILGFGIGATALTTQAHNVDGKGMMSEKRQALETALANKDYTAFKNVVGDGPLGEKITEENFEKFITLHQLKKDGNIDEAKKMAGELGLPTKKMGHMSPVSKEQHAAVEEALEKQDYPAFQAAVSDGPLSKKITEENFAKFAQMHAFMKAGKFDEAKALAKELGLPRKHFGHHKRMDEHHN